MIFDTINNFNSYVKLAPSVWSELEKFIANCTTDTPVGRYEIDGEKVYAMIQSYNLHEFNADKLEIHREFIDIQLLLKGAETIWYRSVDGLEQTQPYAPDCAFFHAEKSDSVPLPMIPGYFAMFLPEEGHQPGVGNPANQVIKMVIKIHRSLLEI